FGEGNLVSEICVKKTTSATSAYLAGTTDFVVWFAKDISTLKFRAPLKLKQAGEAGAIAYNRLQSLDGSLVRPLVADEEADTTKFHLVASDNLSSQSGGDTTRFQYKFRNEEYKPGSGGWKTNLRG